MTEDQLYYAWTPLLVGMLMIAFPDKVVRNPARIGRDNLPVPMLFLKPRENGRMGYACAFQDAPAIRKWVHEHFVNSDMPRVDNAMKSFLHEIKEQKLINPN